ncbi:MAG: Rnase Y domain-containing protein, partial [Chloroflexi bacterium]|nr:Rnase Y domain-containing protein [Chloroflexota bacterium]
MEAWHYAVLAGGMALLGLAGGYWFQLWLTKRQVGEVALNLESELARVETKQREIIADARQQAGEYRREVEAELRERRNETRQRERRLQRREEAFERRVEKLDRRDEELRRLKDRLDRRGSELGRAQEKQDRTLQKIAQLSKDEAREIVLDRVQDEVSDEAAKIIYLAEQDAKQEADRKARWLVGLSLQRVAADHAVESTVSAVPLPSDDMKGRIIGREGRNIRALEAATGVDLIIDDTPETVVLSSFDPVRREIARTALSRLIKDGRIHPARIEETVAKARRDVNTIIREEGERAALDGGGPHLHQGVAKLLGR